MTDLRARRDSGSRGGRIVRAEQGEELVEVDRLRQVRVEAGLERVADVVRLTVASERDEARRAEPSAPAHAARDLETVDVRQADVTQDDLRPEGLRPRDG